MYGIDDPSALLRPWKNLEQFSEELFAMFSKDGGKPPEAPAAAGRAVAPGPPERRPPADPGDAPANPTRKTRLASAQALARLPEAAKGDSHASSPRPAQADQEAAPRPRPTPTQAQPEVFDRGQAAAGRNSHESTRRDDPPADHGFEADHSRTRLVPKDQTDSSAPAGQTPVAPARPAEARQARPTPAAEAADPGTVRRTTERRPSSQESQARSQPPAQEPSRVVPRREGNNYKETDIGDFANETGGGGGTTTFMGLVVSGGGNTYQVTLYQSGPDGPPDKEPVTVKIPMIDPTDVIPAKTWLAPIFQFTSADGSGSVYSCQPPVWMP